jgi:hypothetical protein
MQDLYATTFTLSDVPFEIVAKRMARWAHRGVKRIPDILADTVGESISPNGRRMSWQGYVDDTRRAVFLELSHPDDTDPDVLWRTVVDLSTEGTSTNVTLRIRREGRGAKVAPASFVIRRPALIVDLLADGAFTAGIALSSKPTTLRVDDVPGFLSSVLGSPTRRLPILVVALPPGHEHPVASADTLADELAGLCHVYVLGGHLAWRRLVEGLSEEHRVPQGGARLFWPGWPDTRLRHPWWTRRTLTERERGAPLSKELFRTLSRLSVVRAPRDAVWLALRQQAADALRARATENASDEVRALIDGYEEQLTYTEAEERASREDLVAAQARIAELEQDLAAQQAQWAVFSESLAAPDVTDDEEPAPAPRSWDEIAEVIDTIQTDAFKLTDVATTMTAGNPYPDPERMWSQLLALRNAADAWRERGGEVDGRLRDWILAEFEIEISLQDKKLKGKVDFDYEGTILSGEPHVKVDDFKTPDKCGRIYFAIDSDKLRFVVDHIGLHR